MDVESVFVKLGGVLPIGKSFAPMPLSEVEELEAMSSGGLPDEYRYLLMTYGAFVFEREVYLPPTALLASARHLAPSGLYVPSFYGAPSRDYDETNTVKWNYEEYRSAVGDEFVPFADNGGDDIYFVDTAYLTNGRVVLWKLGGSEVIPVADSFSGFLSALVAM